MSWIGSALALSFLGGLHCAGMCGGFAVLTLSTAPKWRISRHFALYAVGKTSSYAVAGAIFGGLGSVFHEFPLGSRFLAGLTGLVLIAVGLEMAGLTIFRARKPPNQDGWIKKAFGNAVSSITLGNSYAMGVLNGLLPCGLLYAAFAGAASTGHILTGASFMAVFGLGTIPALFVTGHLLSAVSQSVRGKAVRFAGWTILVFGVIMLYKGMAATTSMFH